MDQTVSTAMMKIKVNHNLVVDLEALNYNPSIRPLIEYLRYSPFMKALMMYEKVPLSQLSHVYSTAIYHINLDVVNFEFQVHKTSISKANFCEVLGLSTSSKFIHPNSITISRLILMFHKIGYNSDLSLLSKLKKHVLPPVWNALFTILFKCLLERITGSDGASMIFYSLMYELFSRENVDYGTITWS